MTGELVLAILIGAVISAALLYIYAECANEMALDERKEPCESAQKDDFRNS